MRSKHDCAVMWGHGVSHRASLLGAPMTLPVCSFHARLMPPCMWDQMLPQAYHKIICFSPMRATTYEEPMPVPSVWAWQVANVSQPSNRRIRWQTRESPFRPRVEVETASISNSQTGELPSLCGVNDVCASTASSNMWLATSAQWWSKKPQHDVLHNVLNFKVLETQGGFPKWPSSMAQLTSGNNPQGSAVSATLLERPGPVATPIHQWYKLGGLQRLIGKVTSLASSHICSLNQMAGAHFRHGYWTLYGFSP